MSGTCYENSSDVWDIERCHVLLNTMAQGVLCLNADGTITSVNPAAEKILGMTSSELIGMIVSDPCWQWIDRHGSACKEKSFPWRQAFKKGRAVNGKLLGLTCQDGTHRWIITSAIPLPQAEETKLGEVFVTLSDVTNQISFQEKLRRALRRQVEITDMLQHALKPDKLNVGTGYEIAVEFLTADQGEVSGDIYDVFRTRAGETCILIGDVCGKGAISVAHAVTARSTIRSYAYETPVIGRVFNLTNDVLYARQQEREEFGIFVTAALLALSPETGEFHYAIAGHPPPMIRRRDGAIETLSGGDLALGLMDDHSYRSSSNVLGMGDKIVLYTDGVTDARHNSKFFGIEGLERCIRTFGHLDCPSFAKQTVRAIRRWSKGIIADDTALMVVSRLDH